MDDDTKFEVLSSKKMLKIYNNLNTFQCFSEFLIRNNKVKITIRPPELAFTTIMEFLDAIELNDALKRITYLSCKHFILRIKITASIFEKDSKIATVFKYNIRMNDDFELGGSASKSPLPSDQFFKDK